MKLLLTDISSLHNENDISFDVFEQFGEVKKFDDLSGEELLREAADAQIILCNKTEIGSDVFDATPNLKYIGLFATGYNNIDVKAARERGITVCNAGTYSADAVAQYVFAYMLSHFSAVDKYDRFVKDGNWMRSADFSAICFPTDEMSGKTVGIIGYGSIGKKVARIALAFGMQVLVYTRTPKSDPLVSFVSLDELLKSSDVVTVHCPLNDASRRMFNAERFAKMKDGAYFINTARGGVIEEKDLFDALSSGKLSGAAVDVLEYEPMKKDCILINAPNITITPHIAWAPLTTRERLFKIVADNIKAYLDGTPQNVVS